MSSIIGVDPGKDGAVCLLLLQDAPRFWDTPTIKSSKPGSSKRLYDEAGMVAVLREATAQSQIDGGAGGHAPQVVIEKQQAMPGQGVSSMFSTGEGFGLWKGMLAALGLSWRVVTPQAWKKVVLAGYVAKDKGAAVQVAGRLYPSAAPLLQTARGRILDGRADALCLAEYLRRVLAGENFVGAGRQVA